MNGATHRLGLADRLIRWYGRNIKLDGGDVSPDPEPKPESWVTIVFMQGEEADEVLAMLYEIDDFVWSGPYEESIARTVKHLKQWDYGEESEVYTLHTTEPWGTHDQTVEHDGYVLAWSIYLPHISLNRRIR